VTASIRLEPNLDIRAAAPLRETLLAHVGAPVALDAGHVSRLGALCLQVLLAAERDWSDREVPFTIRDPSPAFTETLRLFGAQEALAPAMTAGAC
jgi:chemotaxis protein CheX